VRHPANSSTAQLVASFEISGGLAGTIVTEQGLSLETARPTWQTLDFTLPTNQVGYIHLYAADARGWLDLDGVEIIDETTGAQLLNAQLGGFARAIPESTTAGDWAANAIERLGAIAWWGSTTHGYAGGYSFFKTNGIGGILAAFFGGRTLGEAIQFGGSGLSGIFYGDPLYRPAAARLYLGDGSLIFGREDEPLAVGPADPDVVLRVNALDGQDNVTRTRWTVDVCGAGSRAACDSTNAWARIRDGVGAAYSEPVPFDLTSVLSDPPVAQTIVFRLRVWNPGEEAEDLWDFGYLAYDPAQPPPVALLPDIALEDTGVGTVRGSCHPSLDLRLSHPSLETPAQLRCGLGGTFQLPLELAEAGPTPVSIDYSFVTGRTTTSTSLNVTRTWLGAHGQAPQAGVYYPLGKSRDVLFACTAGQTLTVSGEIVGSSVSAPCVGGSAAIPITPAQDGALSTLRVVQGEPGGSVTGTHDSTFFPGVSISSVTVAPEPDGHRVHVAGRCITEGNLIFVPPDLIVACSAGSFAGDITLPAGASVSEVLAFQNVPNGCEAFEKSCWTSDSHPLQLTP
jgi:hypothetical protein